MWLWIIKLIPGVASWLGDFGLKFYDAKLKADGAHENKVAELAAKEIDLAGLEDRLNEQQKALTIGKWYEPEHLLAYFIMIPYWFTVITLDYLVFPFMGFEHVTLPLKGDTAQAMTLMTTFWLGARGVQTTARILTSAWKR